MFIYNRGMPRVRTVSDAAILDAAARAIGRVGPAKVTLAMVGKDVGLSPATLLQRFGSKRGLLLTLAKSSATADRARFRSLRLEAASPLAALQRMLIEMAGDFQTPDEVAYHLAFLPMAVTDKAFREQAARLSTVHQQEMALLLDEAVQAGEIIPTDTGRLAQAMYALWNGAILQWALQRGGSLECWLKASLEVLLVPYLRSGE